MRKQKRKITPFEASATTENGCVTYITVNLHGFVLSCRKISAACLTASLPKLKIGNRGSSLIPKNQDGQALRPLITSNSVTLEI